ncbi:MAG TPA: DUF1841 family protein [Solirubrobacteraceae bacterium]|nr:DUF1841 family protein [Solirubrobacteraceae bacterium]
MLAVLGMSIDDLADPDVRSFVIRHEHPEFVDVLEDDGLDEIDLGYGPINPRLHLAMHEIVATHLWDGDPPEVWETAVRLRDAGYERQEILHMLGRPVSDQIWAARHDDQPYDRARHVASLQALPGTWERERTAMSAGKSKDGARKQARRSARAARRRNRRPT